jgi:tetratricopeptide (TPR) repeat protein
LFQQALDRDPTSGDAAAALAYVYEKQGTWEFVPPVVGFEQARRAASTALRLDPKNSLAHLVLGRFHQLYDRDWAAAERELQQAAILAPGSADALNGQAWLSVTLGRWDDALRQIKAALTRDPLDPNSYENLTWVYLGRGDLADAEAAMRRGLDIRRTYGWGHFILGVVLLERGEREAALLEMQQETIDDGQQAGLAMAYYALGRKADSDAALSRILNVQTANNAFGIANAYAFRGQPDQAFHWLDRAYTDKSSLLVYLKSDPPLTRLAADPRFKALLRRMNLSE